MGIEGTSGETGLFSGNEAIARGVLEAGIDLAASYPGTPSTEITEELADYSGENEDLHVEWSTNERVAFDVAFGASTTGARSLVTVKNAGLNWVMDPLMTIVYTGVDGGFVITVADDPGAHYSSNEQDTRIIADYAEIVCLEPSTQEEAKEMAKKSFDLSESIELPVFLRSVTRLSHTRGKVKFGDIVQRDFEPDFDRHKGKNYRWNVYGESKPAERHQWLKNKQPNLEEKANGFPWDKVTIKKGTNIGIIGVGLGYSYAKDVLKELNAEDEFSKLKIGTSRPLPRKKVLKFLENVEKALVLEEGEPFVEKQIKIIAKEENIKTDIIGKSTGNIQKTGELELQIIKEEIISIQGEENTDKNQKFESLKKLENKIIDRPSSFCPGCSHLGTYYALREALKNLDGQKPIINGDIGCYEMAGYGNPRESEKDEKKSPYDLIDTNYVMGSGIGLMEGQYQAGYEKGPLISVCGDSTFFHSVIQPLTNAVHNEAEGVLIVLDNSWTSMTGQQPNVGTGLDISGESAEEIEIEDIVSSVGVFNVRKVNSYDIEKVESAIKNSVKEDGISVVVSKAPCVVKFLRTGGCFNQNLDVSKGKCLDCENCLELGCTAIHYDKGLNGIDDLLCVDCGLCAEICPNETLEMMKKDG